MEEYQSLRDYLNRSGILATGDQKAIAEAKREYRKSYMRRYKRERRSKLREVVLSLDGLEYNRLAKLAKTHGYSVPKFLLHLAETHMQQLPITQHPDHFNGLHLLLAKMHSEVVYMADNVDDGQLNDLERLKAQILKLEENLEDLSHPKDLESYLMTLIDTNEKEKVHRVLERILMKP